MRAGRGVWGQGPFVVLEAIVDLVKAIHVQLSDEGSDVRVLEILR